MIIVINFIELWNRMQSLFLRILLLDWHLYCPLYFNVGSFSKLFLCHVRSSLFDRFWLLWWFRLFWLFWLFRSSFNWSLFSLWWPHNFILPNILFLDFLFILFFFNILNLNLNINTPVFQGVQKLWYFSIFFCHCLILIFHVHILNNNLVQLWDVRL